MNRIKGRMRRSLYAMMQQQEVLIRNNVATSLNLYIIKASLIKKEPPFRFRAEKYRFFHRPANLEHTESLLSCLSPLSLMSDDVELDSLGQRTALSNGNNVTLIDIETGTGVSVDGLVTLLETTVLLDVVKVITTDNDSALHLGRDD